MTRADRVFFALVVVLLAAADLIPRAWCWLDPLTDNRTRYSNAQREVTGTRELDEIWADADERDIPGEALWKPPPAENPPRPFAERAGPALALGVVREVAFRSRATVSRDRWGNRWFLVVGYDRSGQPVDMSELSAGRDGTLDWGGGDDVPVGDAPAIAHPVWPLAFLAAAIALPYLTWRVFGQRRAETLVVEVALTTAIAMPGMFLVIFGIEGGIVAVDSLPLGKWLIVPPRVAIAGTLAATVWAAVYVLRLRHHERAEAGRSQDSR